MMEVTSPKPILVPKNGAQVYEFVDCENWSVIADRRTVVHFDSKEYFIKEVLSGRDISKRIYNLNVNLHPELFNASVPIRSMDMKKWLSN